MMKIIRMEWLLAIDLRKFLGNLRIQQMISSQNVSKEKKFTFLKKSSSKRKLNKCMNGKWRNKIKLQRQENYLKHQSMK